MTITLRRYDVRTYCNVVAHYNASSNGNSSNSKLLSNSTKPIFLHLKNKTSFTGPWYYTRHKNF